MRSTPDLANCLYATAQDPSGPEWRRQLARRDVRSRVRICDENAEEQFGYTVNVTPATMCINCRQELEPFTTVTVSSDNDTNAGTRAVVVHNTQTLGGFKVGLKFQPA